MGSRMLLDNGSFAASLYRNCELMERSNLPRVQACSSRVLHDKCLISHYALPVVAKRVQFQELCVFIAQQFVDSAAVFVEVPVAQCARGSQCSHMLIEYG